MHMQVERTGYVWRQGDGGATSLSGQEETQSILQSLLCMQWPTMLPENKKPAEEFGECLGRTHQLFSFVFILEN